MHLRCWKYMLFHVLLELYITQPFSSSVDSLRGPQCQRQHGLIFSHGSHDFDPARPWRLEQLLPQIHGGTECVWTVIRELFPLEQRCTDFYRCVFMYCSVSSVVFGSWYDHVNNWWKKKQTYSKLHYMFYEDMIEVFHFFFLWVFYNSAYFLQPLLRLVVKRYDGIWSLCLQDTGRELDKLCSFLGLSPSAEDKKQILYGVQFDNMKKNDMTNYSTFHVMDFSISTFMRKGNLINH